MKTYTAYIKNMHSQQIEEIQEMQRARMTKRDFGNIIQGLFSWAAISIDYSNLAAFIFCGDQELMIINCKTVTDGSTIRARVSTGGKLLRIMTVAE